MEPVDLFYSYAHEDEKLRDELAGHLKIMERRNVIRPWHDRCIAPGQNWEHEIDTQLTTADLVLSDWNRPEPTTDAPSAGIDLLRKLRARHKTMPVVFYHGSFKEQERRARRDMALSEGAFGEAVMPDELLGLVASALSPSMVNGTRKT